MSELSHYPETAAESTRLPAQTSQPESITSPHAVPMDDAGWFPLSDMQKAYLVGRDDTLPMGGVSSHVYHEFALGEVDADRLEHALRAVVTRHPSLRTVVRADGMQAVLPPAALPDTLISRHDLRGLPSSLAQEIQLDLRRRLESQVAALDRPCAVDAHLLRVSADRHVLLVSHEGLHIDGLSMQFLFAAWARAYQRPDDILAPLDGLYPLYVEAEQRQRDGRAGQRARQYWTGRLQQGLAPAPQLPLAVNPLHVVRAVTQRFYARLDSAAWERFIAHAAALSITPAAALFAAYCEVLRAWSTEAAMTLNVTVANRLPVAAGIDEAIGNFTSAVLVGVTGIEACFAQRAQAAQQALRESLDYRQFNAMDVARRARELPGNQANEANEEDVQPLYTFNCAIDDADVNGIAQGVDTLGPETYCVSQTPQVWLNVFAMRTRQGLEVQLDAVDGLFADNVPADIAIAFETLLRRLACDPAAWQDTRFDLLPDHQRRARAMANDTASAFPEERIHDAFMRHAATHPDAAAVVTGTRTVTYGELNRMASALAERLTALALRVDEPVVVRTDKGPEQIAALLAALMAGGAYLPIDPCWPRTRQIEIAHAAGARIAIVSTDDGASSDAQPLAAQIIPVTQTHETAAPFAGNPRTTPHDLAYVMYTSGSTGQPKGVMVTHRSVVNLVADINRRFQIGPHDRAFGISQFTFDLSVYDIFGMLSAGGAVVLPEQGQLADPAHWLDLANQHRVTVWNSVPSIVRMLADHCEATNSPLPQSIRLILMSGDRIATSLPQRLRQLRTSAALWSLGGPTETTVWNIGYPIAEADAEPVTQDSIPYGKPLSNSRYYVLNAQMQDCADWTTGELYAAGAGLARGYWQDEARTATRFVTHPGTGERLYRTGDLGRYRSDGNLDILGRSDFQVKLNGHRIETGEVESRLQAHPLVRECVVLGVTAPDQTAELVVFIVPAGAVNSFGTPQQDQLRAHLAALLPSYMVPAKFIALPAFPYANNDKIDRRALVARALSDASTSGIAPSCANAAPRIAKTEGGAAAAAKTEAETAADAAMTDPLPEEVRLLALWADVLKVDSVDTNRSFAEHGGDSMKAARLLARVRKEFAVSAPLKELMRHRTVRAMAHFVAQLRAAQDKS